MPEHTPVLLPEALSFLKEGVREKGRPRVLDGTLGLGGYSEAILTEFPESAVLGIDRDAEALNLAEERLRPFGGRFEALHARFGDVGKLAPGPFDAFVFDLGVSNLQLTEAERGFSFQEEGPLDMRMDPGGDGPTAAEALTLLDARELARIFWEYGGERYSRQIAAQIATSKNKKPLKTTADLVALIRELLPAPVQRKMGGHPARRVFQALRIFVNDELGELRRALLSLPSLAAPGAVAVIVSYHSLEDRIVKGCFRAWEKERKLGQALTRHPVTPGEGELERNHKSRSAKLRAFRFL